MIFFSSLSRVLHLYRMHILVFIIAGILVLTFAHPQMLVTDEWVTVNQVYQLHNGHQIIFNEGKYGTDQNGTPFQYFSAKQNYLAYPLFLPVIAQPAYWLLDLLGNSFIYLIIYLWTFFLIALALTLNTLFPEYTHIGKWRWTTGLIIIAFAGFFINLYLFRPFYLTGTGTYTEIAAIAFTHQILFAFLAVMIYEICHVIFENQEYALFGTLTCISCSSYLFWSNFCKDHFLVAFLITIILLLLVKLWKTEKPVYLVAAFFTTGLLAWARPEIAFCIAVMLCILVIYIWFYLRNDLSNTRDRYLVLMAPVFTFIGAIPFFINNYIFTHNIFIPSFVVWNSNISASATTIAGSTLVQQNSTGSMGSLIVFLQAIIVIDPPTFFTDLYGVLFNPASCSIGVLPLIPIFLVAILLLPVLAIYKLIAFTKKDRQIIGILLLISLGVFLVYLGRIATMNNDGGIVPDIRYLSPIYLPLTLIGLLIIRKIPVLSDRPRDLIKGLFVTWIILIPVSLVIMGHFWYDKTWFYTYPLLNAYASLAIYGISVLFLIAAIYSIIFLKPRILAKIFLILLCGIPLIWQIIFTFIVRNFAAGLGGFSFWIPIVMKWFAFIFIP
ncbi:MAG: hypothetical protein Q7T80_14495 [Methanoregula sp.]|nr:hypothetical protein [Methanoregula sp.]